MIRTTQLVIFLLVAGLVCVLVGQVHSEQTLDVVQTFPGGVAATPGTYVDSSTLYPDMTVTPGAINPAITQANLGQTICNPKWSTKSERPSSAYTTALKKKQLATTYARYDDTKTADFEEDHLVSLELGGNPTDPKNLWPELYTPPDGAREKDKVENYLHAQVCSGHMTLAAAQYQISHDWLAVVGQISGKYGAVNDLDDE